MGWTSYNATHYKKGKIDRIAEVKSLFEGEENYKVLKASSVGSTVYMAIEKEVDGEKIVFGAVYLTSINMKDYYNFSYKDIDETSGPCERECPESILKLLTPTDSKWANEWRNACWENIRKKKEKRKNPDSLSNLPVGSVIEMKYWADNIPVLELKKINYARYKNPIWYSSRTGYKYPAKTIETQGYKVLSRAEAL